MMTKEFTNTDAQYTRLIHSRIKHELNQLPLNNPQSKAIVREYMIELFFEILNDELPEHAAI